MDRLTGFETSTVSVRTSYSLADVANLDAVHGLRLAPWWAADGQR
jgi:hypothetical protein